MKLVLSTCVAAIALIESAFAQAITVVNGHPTQSIVRLEAITEHDGVVLEASVDLYLAPGEDREVKMESLEGDCEFTLIATFEDDLAIQARGVDVCKSPIWTVLDGDFRID